ncbi:MarR family winged helix-turn-helix transcriptional regulator [Aestuariimicrobium kwangyangense]|uniref:MarR family winged helix-turn-helix transcriptional regulator n=1 Tax=Aestuariimicrobium kwangyangense TaxID=396389 RepID=UPI0003B3077B|nr:MarR family transcriptional regulator [Aestuariimicrobium kwangyangense]
MNTQTAATGGRERAVARLEGAMEDLTRQIRTYYGVVAQRVAPGLQPATFKVLTTIDRMAPVSVSALADALQADKGQISRAITELEGRGLVRRAFDPGDARVRMIAPTDEAKQKLVEARSPFHLLLQEALEEWGVEEVDQFADLLAKLSGTIRAR